MGSPWLLGASNQQVQDARVWLGPRAERMLVLAQRIVWGIAQADLVRVDVPRALTALRREFPTHPMTHVLAAFVLHAGDPAQAERELQQARDTAARHPLAFMLPSPSDWRGEPSPSRLLEVSPGRVWRLQGSAPQHGTRFHVDGVATLVRTERGELTYINPVGLSRDTLEAVRALGAVSSVVVQGRAHSHFVPEARAQFPDARVLLSEGHLTHPASRHLPHDGVLATESAQLSQEFLALPVRGTQADEVALYHRPSSLLVFQDLVSNNTASHEARTFAGRLEYFAFGLVDRIGLLSYHPILWHDLAAFQRSLRALVELDAKLVTGAHWPLMPVSGEDKAAFDDVLRWVLALTKPRHLALVARFFAAQPGFLRDLVTYRLRAR